MFFVQGGFELCQRSVQMQTCAIDLVVLAQLKQARLTMVSPPVLFGNSGRDMGYALVFFYSKKGNV